MSAHIALPGIDAGPVRPGTVVPDVLTGILRDSLGFRGLVVTDALNMGGVVNSSAPRAAVRAFLAGADLLLQPADPAVAIAAMERAPSQRGEISAGATRPLGAPGARAQAAARPLRPAAGAARQRSARRRARRFQQEARAHRPALDRDGEGRGRRGARSRAAAARRSPLVTYAEEDNRTVGNVLAAELRAWGSRSPLFKLWPASGPASYDSAAAAIARARRRSSPPPTGRPLIAAPSASRHRS